MRVLYPLGLVAAILLSPLGLQLCNADAAQRSTERPTTTDPRIAARQAVARFMTAVDAADAEALRDAIYCDLNVTAQRQGLIAVIDCIVFQRALERMMAARWGEDAVRAMARRTTFSAADHAALPTARVERRESGDSLVILAPQQSPIVVRPCDDGQWRVVLRAVRTLYDSTSIEHATDRLPQRLPEPGSKRHIEYIRGVALILRRTAKAVNEGKFPTPTAARAALEKALADATITPVVYDPAQDGPEEQSPR